MAGSAVYGVYDVKRRENKTEGFGFYGTQWGKAARGTKAVNRGKKTEAFKLTYSDKEYLYICIGYGEKETGGYSIAVNELYLTDNAVYVETELLGPGPENKTNNPTPSYPYIVIKTEYLEQTVIFE